MESENEVKSRSNKLPVCAKEYIKQVLRKMRYRREVRQDVQAELSAHFEDELKECASDEEKEQKAERLIAGFGNVKLLAVLLRRAKKRCRPLWQTMVARTFQTVGVLIVCFVIYVVWFLTGKPVVTVDYIAELNRIVRPTADDSQNAAPLYHKAAKAYEELPDDIVILLHTRYKQATAEQKPLINKWLADNKEILDLVIAGTQKPYYWQKYEEGGGVEGMMSIPMPHLTEFRRLAYALRWRAQLHAEQGRYEEAFDDLKSCYRLGRHLKDGPFLIEQLVGFSIERTATEALLHIFCEHEIDLVRLTKLQQDFEEMLADEDFTVDFEAEKLFLFDEIQRSFTGSHYLGEGHIIPKHIYELYPMVQVIESLSADSQSISPAKKQEPSWVSKFISDVRYEIYELGDLIYEAGSFVKKNCYILFLHPNKQETFQAAQKFYDYWERMKVKTPGQIQTEAIDIEEVHKKVIAGNVLLELLAPALARCVELSHLNECDVKSLIAIIALLRYEKRSGHYPDDLQELTSAGYLKELPMDPYSDKPLIYKRTDDNFLLYSVGPNFTDDGGESGKDTKGRVRKWRNNGDTVFWPVPKLQLKQ